VKQATGIAEGVAPPSKAASQHHEQRIERVAYAAVATGVYQQIAGTPLIWLIMLAPLGAVLFLSFRIEQMSAGTAQATFWTYAALMGLSLASIFLLFTGTSIARVFLHRCRNVRRDEPLRLHDAARPVGSARAYSRALSATDRRAASTVAGVLIQLARSWRVARRARRLGPNTISSIPRKGELLPPVRAAK
jgi:hypothetical protein